MKRNILTILKVLVSVGLAAFLLFLVFRNIEWIDFWQKAAAVDYSWVVASVILSIIPYVARAYRWNILLKPLGHNLKTSRTTVAVLIGYLANLALPRLGEITRCGVLNRNDKVPVPDALGTVIVERLIDVLTLLVLMGLSLFIEYERLMKFLMDAFAGLALPSWVTVVFPIVAILGLAVLIIFIRKQSRKQGKLASIIKGFTNGLLSLKDISNPVGFVISTLAIWIAYFLMSYIIVFSLPETSHLNLSAGLMLLITGGIALAIPVQSGFGTYHGMIAGMLLLYSVEADTGIFLATLLHTSQILAIALFGTIALLVSALIRRKKTEKVHEFL
ncbi:MAG: lysylphosphatidylglycerol synthase transmembrane domain-containing protein [Cyclobacteriaceae bacterium]